MKKAWGAALALSLAAGTADAQYCEDVDLVHDGALNLFDLVALFEMWHVQDLTADFNADAEVDGLDLGYQIAHFDDAVDDCLPLPVNAEIGYLEVDDVTDVVMPDPGYRAFDVFLTAYEPDAVLLNVFDANVNCVQEGCFVGPPFGSYLTIGAEPHFNPDINYDMDAFLAGESLGEDAGWYALGFEDPHPGMVDAEGRVQIARFIMQERTFLTGKASFLVHQPSAPTVLAWQCMDVEIPVNDCYADFNLDGALDILDFVAYQNAFVAGDPEADCDGCGNLNILDFVCFQNRFHEGCD